MTVLRIGARTSQLAVTQAEAVGQQICAAGLYDAFELVGITTRGDTDRRQLSQIGGTGLFTNAVRQALLAGECDLVVHSAKDLPAADSPDFAMFFSAREAPCDVLYGKYPSIAELPAGARVGTGSPRRIGQLLRLRPDVEAVPIRGNVPTRIARAGADLDAVIVARAGLDRLGIAGGHDIPVAEMVPAPTQGILALETLPGTRAEAAAAQVESAEGRAVALAERSFMVGIEAGCSTPVGALATVAPGTDELHLFARWTSPDGTASAEDEATIRLELAAPAAAHADPRELGFRLAAKLLEALGPAAQSVGRETEGK